MNSASTRGRDDTITYVVVFAILATGILALTSVGMIAIGATLALVWFFGRPNLALCLLAFGVAWISVAAAMGAYNTVPVDLWAAYSTALRGGAIGIAQCWLEFASSGLAWIALSPVGLCCGAVLALLRADQSRSMLAALGEGRTLDDGRRPPVAYLLHRLLERRSPRQRAGTLIGSAFRTGTPVIISDADRNRHVLALGTTGSGKTVSVLNLVEAAIEGRTGVVYLDGKGDRGLAKRVVAFARSRGRKAYVFDGMSSDSAVYNPFSSGDCTSLADRIVCMREWTEPHYQILATGFAQTAFKVLQHCGLTTDLVSATQALDTKTWSRPGWWCSSTVGKPSVRALSIAP